VAAFPGQAVVFGEGAGRFASAVSVTVGGQTADAKSVLGVMGLFATSASRGPVRPPRDSPWEERPGRQFLLREKAQCPGLPYGRRPGPPTIKPWADASLPRRT
jgi:hypothetical protein